MGQFDKHIDQQIKDAMAAGKFDNLKGQGKPLKLDDENPYEPEGWGMAFRMLSDNGFAPPWIEDGQEIEQEFRAAVARLKAAYERTTDGVDWQSAQADFRSVLEKLNRKILNYNLRAPAEVFKRPTYDAQAAINAVISQR